MKTVRLLALFLAVTAVFARLTQAARAETQISFSFFHDSLEPHGEWLQVADYGYCWRPNGVQDDWSPYTDGYWTYTDAGWTWVSYEDWGSICYHYGRWARVEDEGWCWVPDYEWGPAWVSWRTNDAYVGWAPLPPEARWERDTGFSVWVDNSYDIGPGYYRFCDVRDFGAPVIREVCFPPARNITIFHSTVNITNISYNRDSNVIFNGGPEYAVVSSRSARPVPALKLVRNKNINKLVLKEGGRSRRPLPTALQRGNQLEVFAPDAVRPVKPDDIKVKTSKMISKEKVNKGWTTVGDPKLRAQLKEKVQLEAKGLTRETAPAKAVQVSDLKAVPEKADPNAPSPVLTTKAKGGRLERGSREPRQAADSKSRADQSFTSPAIGELNGDRGKGKADAVGKPEPVVSDAQSKRGLNEDNTPAGRDADRKNRREQAQGGDSKNDHLRNPGVRSEAVAHRNEHLNAQDAGRLRDAQRAANQAHGVENSPQDARRAQQDAAREEAAQASAIQQRRQQNSQAMRVERHQEVGAQRQLARQQQLESRRAVQQQQRAVESHQAAQQQRAIESQRSAQQQRQVQIQRSSQRETIGGRGSGGGAGAGGAEARGRGKREVTAEEAAARRGR